MEKDEERGMSAQKVGKAICGIALKRKVRPIYVIGGSYRFLCALEKILPGGERRKEVEDGMTEMTRLLSPKSASAIRQAAEHCWTVRPK
jgi:hypothetical protein